MKIWWVLLPWLFALAACSSSGSEAVLSPARWRSLTVHYSVRIGEAIEYRQHVIDDEVVIETLGQRHGALAPTPAACTCEISNWIEVALDDETVESWHFCHEPSRLVGPMGEALTNGGLYYGLRAVIERHEESKSVSLFAEDYELLR